MATFAHTVEIARPVEEVFAFLSEPANLPRWQRSLLDDRPHRRGPLRCGLEVTERRRFLAREMETTLALHRAPPMPAFCDRERRDPRRTRDEHLAAEAPAGRESDAMSWVRAGRLAWIAPPLTVAVA